MCDFQLSPVDKIQLGKRILCHSEKSNNSAALGWGERKIILGISGAYCTSCIISFNIRVSKRYTYKPLLLSASQIACTYAELFTYSCFSDRFTYLPNTAYTLKQHKV